MMNYVYVDMILLERCSILEPLGNQTCYINPPFSSMIFDGIAMFDSARYIVIGSYPG
jgi:hypothetical protein